MYGIFGRESTKYTVIYGVYIQFSPTLCMFVPQPSGVVRAGRPHLEILYDWQESVLLSAKVLQSEMAAVSPLADLEAKGLGIFKKNTVLCFVHIRMFVARLEIIRGDESQQVN